MFIRNRYFVLILSFFYWKWYVYFSIGVWFRIMDVCIKVFNGGLMKYF